MKKMIFAVLAMLMVSGSAFCQTAYEKKRQELTANYVNNLSNKLMESYQRKLDFGTANRIKQYQVVVNAAKGNEKTELQDQFVAFLLPLSTAAALTDGLFFQQFTDATDKFKKDNNSAKSLMTPAEKAEDKRIQEAKMYEGRILYDLIPMLSKELIPVPTKEEFETTADFNKRLNVFNDSANYYFKELAVVATAAIIKFVNEDYSFELGNYSADKKIYAVSADPKENDEITGGKIDGAMSISAEEAKDLKQKGYYVIINPLDVYTKEYLLFPSKITVVNKADTTKKYVANFPKQAGATDIILKGSELWKENPQAKNLTYNYKDLVSDAEKRTRDLVEKEERSVQTYPDGASVAGNTGGRSRSSIMRVVNQNTASLQYAYNERLKDNPGIQGRVTVKWAIDEFGNVIRCNLVGSTINDENIFEQTIMNKVKTWTFGKIDVPGDVTEIEYPFVFTPN